MTQDSGQLDNSVLAAGSVTGAGTGQTGDGSVALPRLPSLGVDRAVPRLQRALQPLGGKRAIAVLLVGAFLVVAFATAGSSALVPQSSVSYPSWESGPLHVLHGALGNLLGSPHGLNIG
jgi:hypothetical protein